MRPSLVIATAVAGIVVALGVVAMLFQPRDGHDQGPAPPTVTGRQPAFHLDATPEQRRAILEATFPRIASERAERLGGIKDDIALLLDDPDAVRYVLDRWHIHRNESKYAQAAFADIFRLVKHPDFVGPTAELLDSPRPEIRGKAVQSAHTQASPELGPRILAIYRAAVADPQAISLKLSALRAAVACRGDAFAAVLREASRDPSAAIAVEALALATDLEVPGLEADARALAASAPDRRVRLAASALLMRRGDLSAQDAIISALDPRDPGVAADALHLVAKYRIAAAAPKLRAFRPGTTGEIRRLFTLALLCLRDPDVINETIQEADAAGGPGEIDALQLLAASGDVDASPILLLALERGGSARVRAIAAGITTSGEKGFLPVIEKLVEQPVSHPAELDEAPRVAGKALVPRLSALLRTAGDQTAQARYLAWLAQIGGVEAREAMLRERSRIPRLVDEQIRLVDLEARRLGQTAPPLAPK